MSKYGQRSFRNNKFCLITFSIFYYVEILNNKACLNVYVNTHYNFCTIKNNIKIILFGCPQFNYLKQLDLWATLVISLISFIHSFFFSFTHILGQGIRCFFTDKVINDHNFHLGHHNKYLVHYFPHNWHKNKLLNRFGMNYKKEKEKLCSSLNTISCITYDSWMT